MSPDKINTVDDMEFWERLYQSGNLPWDLGGPSPPLMTFLSSPYAVGKGSMAVLGCGTGHDSLLFATNGYQVTGIDFAPSAIQATYQKFLDAGVAGTTGFLLERNVFDLQDYTAYFDNVLEHSFFNSIEPSRRRSYVLAVKDILKPGGKLIALWWVLDRQGGPPFGVPRDELFHIFNEFFTFDLVFQPTNSHPSRAGNELFTLMTRR